MLAKMAAVSELKFAFFIIIIVVGCCARQNALAAPPQYGFENGSSSGVSPGLPIFCKENSMVLYNITVSLMIRSPSWKWVKAEGLDCSDLVRFYPLKHVILTSCGVDDSGLGLTVHQLKQYRIVAKSMVRLNRRLDFMSIEPSPMSDVPRRLNDVSEEGYAAFVRSGFKDRAQLIKGFEKIDNIYRESPELGKTYSQLRESVAKEYENVDLKLINFSQLSEKDLPTDVRQQMMIHYLDREFILQFELLSRNLRYLDSTEIETLAMGKAVLESATSDNSKNLEKVQRIYDSALAEAASALIDAGTPVAKDDNAAKALFQKLRESFEKYPDFNQKLSKIKENVEQEYLVKKQKGTFE